MAEEKKRRGGRRKNDGLGKTGGRKKGTPNKVTSEAKEILADIINKNANEVLKRLEEITDPKDYVLTYLKIAEFVLPKKAAVSMSAEVKTNDLRSELEEMAKSEE